MDIEKAIDNLKIDKASGAQCKKNHEELIAHFDQLKKRLAHDENESRMFGEYFLKYVPLML